MLHLKEKGCGGWSPCWTLRRVTSSDFKDSRGGVPVFNLPYLMPKRWKVEERLEAASPMRPADHVFLPM